MNPELALLKDIMLGRLSQSAAYLARREYEDLVSRIKDPRRVDQHGYKIYSQNDEDGILEEIFRRLGITQGTFVEIGVETGLECNSLALIHRGWRGGWIEGNTAQRQPIEQKFASLLSNGRLKVLYEMVSRENINLLLKRLDRGAELDLLSIDIDGNDIFLLEALEGRPKVICIEYNAKFPANMKKRPVYKANHRWQGTDYMGASLAAIDEAARGMGYRLVGTNIVGANAFFVRADLAGDLFAEDATPAALYHPARYYLTFDLFTFVGHRPDFGPYADLVDP